NGTRNVTLDDEVERLDLALFESLGEVLKRHALTGLRQCGVALDCLTLLSDLAGGAVVFRNKEQVAGAGHRVQTLDLDRTRRSGLFNALAVLVDHGADAAVSRTSDDRVTDAQRTALNEDSSNGSAALVELRFNRDTACFLVRVSAQVETSVGGKDHGVQEVLDAGALTCRHVDE